MKHQQALTPVQRSLIVIGLALIVRLLVLSAIFVDPERAVLASDARQYLPLAQNIVEHGVFSSSSDPPFLPEVLRTPGYPLFLAMFVPLCGPRCLTGIAAGQAVLGTLIALVVVLLGHKLFDERTGLLAGSLYAVAPISAIMTGYVYAETLFAALLASGALLLVMGCDESAHKRWWTFSGLGGILFGLAALTRPIGLMLPPLLVLVPLTQRPIGRIWRQALITLLGFALIAAPWMARNATFYGRFALTTISNLNLYYYNAPSLEAHRLSISLDEARAMLDEEAMTRNVDYSRWPGEPLGTLARETIRAHPIQFLWFNGVDALNGFRPGFSFMLSLFGDRNHIRDPIPAFMHGDIRAVITAMRGQDGLILALECYMLIFVLGLILFGLVGIITLLTRRAWPEFVLLVLVPALLLYLPGIASNARFRAPVEPSLVIVAAVGFYAAVEMIRHFCSKKFRFTDG